MILLGPYSVYADVCVQSPAGEVVTLRTVGRFGWQNELEEIAIEDATVQRGGLHYVVELSGVGVHRVEVYSAVRDASLELRRSR